MATLLTKTIDQTYLGLAIQGMIVCPTCADGAKPDRKTVFALTGADLRGDVRCDLCGCGLKEKAGVAVETVPQ